MLLYASGDEGAEGVSDGSHTTWCLTQSPSCWWRPCARVKMWATACRLCVSLCLHACLYSRLPAC